MSVGTVLRDEVRGDLLLWHTRYVDYEVPPCPRDTDGDGNCPEHPRGCPPPQEYVRRLYTVVGPERASTFVFTEQMISRIIGIPSMFECGCEGYGMALEVGEHEFTEDEGGVLHEGCQVAARAGMQRCWYGGGSLAAMNVMTAWHQVDHDEEFLWRYLTRRATSL